MRLSSGIPAVLLACFLAGICGCRFAPNTAAASSKNAKHYSMRGVVVSTDTAKSQAVVDTDAIPGYMDPMTMPYTVSDKGQDAGILAKLRPGDTITATLTVSANFDVLSGITVVGHPAKINFPKPAPHKPLVAGESVPNFSFLDQSNQTVNLAQYHGKVLLMTFIYTRCPLANYCPRMSRNFADINNALAKDPALYAKTHLLSVSFDPAHDTPAVLRSYGGAYTGKFTESTFDHWTFAAPSEAELKQVLNFFLIDVVPGPHESLTHSLSTVVIAPDGKIYRWYPGNDWTPQQLLADVHALLKSPMQG